MIKNIYVCIVLSIFLCACSKEKKTLEEKLTGDNYKYWIVYKHYPPFEVDSIFNTEEYIPINYFDKKGKFFLFYKDNLLSEVKKDSDYYVSDIVNSNTWHHLKGDSILIINGIDYKIKELEDDMMILYNPYCKKYVLYIVAPDSLIPIKYHCLQE